MLILRYWLPVALWIAVILTASSGTFSSTSSGQWFRLLFGTDPPQALHFAVRKAAHVIEYAILALLAWRALGHTASRLSPAAAAAGALGIALVVAVTDESLQSLVPSRSGSAWDVLLDVSGAALAVGLAAWMTRRRSLARTEH